MKVYFTIQYQFYIFFWLCVYLYLQKIYCLIIHINKMFYDHGDLTKNETIVALSTPAGSAAIAVIRLSGFHAIEIAGKIYSGKSNLSTCSSHSVHFGSIMYDDELVDEVLISIFKEPHSYTGENTVEISCHGSIYIQQKILEACIFYGSRMAKPGEFTFRAFMNGKFDLIQAEAVADLIASDSHASHRIALEQMRGGYSEKIKYLRQQLVNFSSLIELELDFSEEDVEFADRSKLLTLLNELNIEIKGLIESFRLGNVLKHGIPVAIIGKPNVGKSTLLNAILNEEKAIVSEIPGTTRDIIEDTISIHGYTFRFIDTAGLRDHADTIESIGIERTKEKIKQALIILYVFDISETTISDIRQVFDEYKNMVKKGGKKMILIANKIDNLLEIPKGFKDFVELDTLFVSAKRKENIHEIAEYLTDTVEQIPVNDQTIVSNLRHYEAFNSVAQNIEKIRTSLADGVSTDLVSIDIRDALYHLGEITGEVTSDEILDNIFRNFCIGK